MAPLQPYDDPTTDADDRAKEFEYVFDVREVQGQEVIVKVVMHLRHLPPYLIRELNDYYPNGLDAADLLPQLEDTRFLGVETEPERVPRPGA